MCHVHASDYTHRDLKLENVLIDEDDISKIFLIDFGFAKKYKDEKGNTERLTEFLGTK